MQGREGQLGLGQAAVIIGEATRQIWGVYFWHNVSQPFGILKKIHSDVNIIT